MGSKGPVVFKYFQSGQGASKELWRGQKSVTRPQSPFESALNFGSITLLWGEAQLCLPYVCLQKKVMTYSDPMVTYSHPKMTYSYPKVT